MVACLMFLTSVLPALTSLYCYTLSIAVQKLSGRNWGVIFLAMALLARLTRPAVALFIIDYRSSLSEGERVVFRHPVTVVRPVQLHRVAATVC